jgi:hypothetical protein
MGLELAHVLEWGPKAGYPPDLLRALARVAVLWFGNVGSAIFVLAIVATAGLVVRLRRDHLPHRPVIAAAALELVGLVVFLAVVLPVKLRFPVHGSGRVPADWAALRDRWELGHSVGFALFTAAFVLLLASALRPVSATSNAASAVNAPNAERPDPSRATSRPLEWSR